MRVLIALVLVLAALVALWQFELVKLPFSNRQAPVIEESERDLFAVVKANDSAAVRERLAAGASINAKDQYGQTPLMYAASEASEDIVATLVAAGSDVNAKTDTGWTALLYAARDSKDLQIPLLLLNAGADPTVRNSEGQGILDVAGLTVRGSTLYNRLSELVDKPFSTDWPSGYTLPVEGATLSSRANHLPGAPRTYRNGVHQGFDFYSGVVSVAIEYGTPIKAVADGEVIRADHDYVEMSQETYDQVILASKNSLNTPEDLLDRLRGRQVWIEHSGGFVSRYAHLSVIPEDVQVGQALKQGDEVGETGNSGTLEAVQSTQDDPHPHVEIWKGETYLGQGLEPSQIYDLAAQVFGKQALPPYTE